jgi:hypothetical protein
MKRVLQRLKNPHVEAGPGQIGFLAQEFLQIDSRTGITKATGGVSLPSTPPAWDPRHLHRAPREAGLTLSRAAFSLAAVINLD